MPILTPLGVDARVNTVTADGQISPRIVALADGKYMVIWVGSVIQPVVSTGGTIAPAYANADIRAQIFNADGTPSGSEFIVNTTTAGGQLRPVVAQLSDGNILISWHDGVGPTGGSAETSMNTIRAQEFSSAGVPVGAEFVIGNSNGRLHALAPTPTGGFVAVFQQGGTSAAFPAGNIIAQVYDSNNVQISSFVVDNTQPLAFAIPFVAVEADGNIAIYWNDNDPYMGVASRGLLFDTSGAILETVFNAPLLNIGGAVTLATGGHAVLYSNSAVPGTTTIYAMMQSVDGSLQQEIVIAQVSGSISTPTITALANGGFIAYWTVDTDPGAAFVGDIWARAFNAIGNPIGAAFQVNTITSGTQYTPSFVQLTDGDIVAAWTDESLLNGDTSGSGINVRRIDFDPVNVDGPTASNFSFIVNGVEPGVAEIIDPYDYEGFGLDGIDADGDEFFISGVSNFSNGTVTLNPDGTLSLFVTPGATERLSFDYTLTDGQGAFATARATVTTPTDFLTMRMGETALIDFLANDYYTPGPGATGFIVTTPYPMDLGSLASGGVVSVVSTPSGQRIFYNTIDINAFASNPVFQSLFNLQVGQTTQVYFSYYNNERSSSVNVTLEGWAQLGGTVADNLVGTVHADHLSGGLGAANILTGGAGDDWYTVSVAGDTIIELAGEGTDSVRTELASFTLPSNVENLHFIGVSGGLAIDRFGYGNDGNNLIRDWNYFGTTHLYGLGGNDTLVGRILDGGDGDDTLQGWTASYGSTTSGVEVDLRITGPQNTLGSGLDTLIGISNLTGSAFNDVLRGNDNWNILDGGTGVSNLYGYGGDDRLILGAGADGSIVDGGTGIDRLVVTGNAVNLSGFAGIEIVELTDGGSLTLTNEQVTSGWLPGYVGRPALVGSGLLTINMTSASNSLSLINFEFNSYYSAGGPFTGSIAINGTSSADTILAGYNPRHIIASGDGDDRITAYAFHNTIDGGAGTDTVTYSGNRSSYTFETANNGSAVRVRQLAYNTGDLLQNVEYVQFADQRVYIGPNNRPTLGSAAITDQTVPDNTNWSYQLPANAFVDPDNDTLSYTATLANGNPLPSWMSFNAATRTFSGTPYSAGVAPPVEIRVRATDNYAVDPGSYAEDFFTVTMFFGNGPDVIGTEGNDYLVGVSNRVERSFGLGGNDYLYGSGGADYMDGGTGIDWLSFANYNAVTVNLATGIGMGNEAEGDIYVGIENVSGSQYADTLIGSDDNNILWGFGGNDILDGGAGNDELRGNLGNDILNGGAGADTMAGGTGDDIYFVDDAGDVTTEFVLDGIDRINTVLAIFTLVTGVENLAFIGSGNAVLTGNANGNLIIGGAGDDIITGIVGSDNLNGGGGNDRFILFSGELASIVDGGSGIDTLVVAPNPGFAGGTLQFTTVSAIEALELSGGVNVIFSGTQFANGLANNSALTGTGTITVNMDAGVNFSAAGMSFASTVATEVNGTSANDVIKLGLGASTGNTVNSGDGVDQIRGSNGVDTINGGIGNDKIMGIGGADVLTGGAGNDQFRYFQQSDSGLGAAADRITDFTIGGDRLNFLLIDADVVTAGDQAFNFVGTAAFANTGIGQIRYQNSGADLLVQADVNGDGVADMEIILQGRAGGTLTAADFIL